MPTDDFYMFSVMYQFSFGSGAGVDLYFVLLGNLPSFSVCFVFRRMSSLYILPKVDHIDTAHTHTHDRARRKKGALAAVVRHEAINLIVLPTEQYFIFIESNVFGPSQS